MSNLDIKSETINKAIDQLVEPVYKDVAKPTINTAKGALGFCSKFIVSGIKPYMYSKIKECEYKIMEIDKRLEEKYNNIPDENKTEPRTNILGPAVDVLKYNLEEEHIKNFFINLIGNDMDKSKQSKVLPSYIEIVKQLSRDDAKFLKKLQNLTFSNQPIMRLRISYTGGGFTIPSNDILLIDNQDVVPISAIIIDNLSRLKVIDVDFSNFLKNDTLYQNAFNKASKITRLDILNTDSAKLDYLKGLLKVTDFGKNFIDICLS